MTQERRKNNGLVTEKCREEEPTAVDVLKSGKIDSYSLGYLLEV